MENIQGLNSTNRGSNMSNNEKLPGMYKIAQTSYTKFQSQMDKSDFANSPRRYISELSYIKSLKDLAAKFKLQGEIEKLDARKKEIDDKLKEFGIKVDE